MKKEMGVTIQHGLQEWRQMIMTAFSQNLILQEAFETAAQINNELKITEFNGAF